jgi:hypothetical protein
MSWVARRAWCVWCEEGVDHNYWWMAKLSDESVNCKALTLSTQFLEFFLPLFGLLEKEIHLGIRSVRCHGVMFYFVYCVL